MSNDTPSWKEGAKAGEKKQWDAGCSSTNIQELQRLIGFVLGIPNTFCEAKGPVLRLGPGNQNRWTNEDIQVTEGLVTLTRKVNMTLIVYAGMIPNIYASGSSRKRL